MRVYFQLNLLPIVGPFLGRVLEDMRKKIDGNFNQTLHIYSGHDSTIANVLSALGQYNFQLPPYSSSVLFELREKDDNYFITVRMNSILVENRWNIICLASLLEYHVNIYSN